MPSSKLLTFRVAACALGFAAIPGASFAQGAPYTVTTVQHPDDPGFTQLLGINNTGTIAGFHGEEASQGFTLTLPSTFTPQNFPASTQTMTAAINGAGSTAGIYSDVAGVTHGYTNIGGNFATVDRATTPAFNQALGINSQNVTVGYSGSDIGGQVGQLAYSQSGGTFTDINALLPSNQNSQAVGINAAGAVVGFYLPTADTSVGFLDVGGRISTIDPFGSANTQALGINSFGEIVGFYVDAGGAQHGYTFAGGAFASFDPVGSVGTTINGVNDFGNLVGLYTTADDNTVGFVAAPVPEPATYLLMGIGLLGLTAVRRRHTSRG